MTDEKQAKDDTTPAPEAVAKKGKAQAEKDADTQSETSIGGRPFGTKVTDER